MKKKIKEAFGVINDNISIIKFNSKIIKFLLAEEKLVFSNACIYLLFLRYYWAVKKIL